MIDLEKTGVCQTISRKLQGKLRSTFGNKISEEIIGYSRFVSTIGYKQTWNNPCYSTFVRLVKKK